MLYTSTQSVNLYTDGVFINSILNQNSGQKKCLSVKKIDLFFLKNGQLRIKIVGDKYKQLMLLIIEKCQYFNSIYY